MPGMVAGCVMGGKGVISQATRETILEISALKEHMLINLAISS